MQHNKFEFFVEIHLDEKISGELLHKVLAELEYEDPEKSLEDIIADTAPENSEET